MYITPPRSGVQRGGAGLFSGSMAGGTFLLRRFAFESRLSFFLFRKKETACDMLRFYSARVGIALVRSRMPYGYLTLRVHFGFMRFFAAIPTGVRSRRRGEGVHLREPIGLVMFSAGRTLGAARPQTCAKEPLALWTLFI